jgi:hypothetical protein
MCTLAIIAHLFERRGLEQNPAELYHLSRVLRNIDPVLIARSRDVNHDITVDFEGWTLLGGHGRGDSGDESGARVSMLTQKPLDKCKPRGYPDTFKKTQTNCKLLSL